ncbi:MAG TPA: ABC transporter permease, partial [Acidimicrobiia bacterium]|nr:ABC transporter permease [Acidimicrobiia bacterium]
MVAELFTRRFAEGGAAQKIVGTVGLLLAVQGTLTVIFGPGTRIVPQFLPAGSFRLPGVTVGFDQLIIVVVAAVSAGGLFAFFRFSTVGVAMRAVVDDPDLLGMTGVSPVRVRVVAWVIGSTFAALSGVLIVPFLGLDAVLLTLLIVQAFGAAAIGRFSSLAATYAGGLVVGVAASLATKYVGSHPGLSGLPPSMPFLILFVALLLTRRGSLREPAVHLRLADRAASRIPVGLQRLLGLVAVVGLAVLPFTAGARLVLFTTALAFVPIFVSLALLVRVSGQVSLCHAAFAAVGAAAFSHLSADGLPWAAAFLLAGLFAVPLGALIAVPAIRLSGLYLALATFGFGLLAERLLFRTDLMFGATASRRAPRPHLPGIDVAGDRGFYFVVLAVVVLCCLAVVVVQRCRLGRLLRAMGDAPVALTTYGANVNLTRVIVFCLSAFMASLSGALFAAQTGTVSPLPYASLNSLLWLAVLAIAGRRVLMAAFLAAFLLVVAPDYVPEGLVEYQTLLFGVLAMASTVSGV